MEPGKKITYKIKNYTSGDISVSGDHLGRLPETGQKSSLSVVLKMPNLFK